MGRHSAPRSTLPLSPSALGATGPRHAKPPAPRKPFVLPVAFRRPLAAQSAQFPRPPLWRRSPALPAAVAVLAVWAASDLPQLLTAEHAGGTVSRAAAADLGLSGLGGDVPGTVPSSAISNSAARLAAADGRVSRDSRGPALTGRAAGTPSRVTVRPATPVVRAAASVAHWVRPSAGVESSCFCMRWGVMHEGIDLAGPLGSPIVAVGDGVVVEAGPAEGFGLWVAIRHDNGDYSIYGHMYHYYVRVGQRVRAGQHIADIGANGQSTGPHLHFAIARGGVTGPFLDPVPWLKARGVDIGRYNPDA